MSAEEDEVLLNVSERNEISLSSSDIEDLVASVSYQNDRSVGSSYRTCPAAERVPSPEPFSDFHNSVSADDEVFSFLEDEALPRLSESTESSESDVQAAELPREQLRTSRYPKKSPLAGKKFISKSHGSLTTGKTSKDTSAASQLPVKVPLPKRKFLSKSQTSLTQAGGRKPDYSKVESKVKKQIEEMRKKYYKANLSPRAPVPETTRSETKVSVSGLPESGASDQGVQSILLSLKEARTTIRFLQQEICRLQLENSRLQNTNDDLRRQLNSQKIHDSHVNSKLGHNSTSFFSRDRSLSSISSSEAACLLEDSVQELISCSRQTRQLHSAKGRKGTPVTKSQKLAIKTEEIAIVSPSKSPETVSEATSYKQLPERFKRNNKSSQAGPEVKDTAAGSSEPLPSKIPLKSKDCFQPRVVGEQRKLKEGPGKQRCQTKRD